MKALKSYVPVKPIPRTKGRGVIVEQFDIQKPSDFKPLNNTRKVEYPMMLRKYLNGDIEKIKKIQEVDLDDFRGAMQKIVKDSDNDDIFSEALKKKSGRAISEANSEARGMKKFISSVGLERHS